MAAPQPIPLTLAVCLFPMVTTLDYQGPVELFSFLTPISFKLGFVKGSPRHIISKIAYLSHSKEPVISSGGPPVLPSDTYEDIMKSDEQFDILLVPGGPGSEHASPLLIEFLQKQAPGAKYILSVCTGSWILARAGLLDGKKATTNKAEFRRIKEDTKTNCNVEWVHKARWVVDPEKRTWTSSGVTAGMDMTNAFLTHITSDHIATSIRGIVELSVRGRDQDEFADYYGLN